jgi:flavin reductase (DIM6/NTAB) family NADH-FMN oxidoreductase RutF
MAMKTFKTSDLSVLEIQNYLNHVVAPRPIALVSTIDKAGNINLSPFSFFNLFSVNPPVCVFSPSRRVRDNTTKDTLQNLQEVPECVIQMVNYDMVQQTSLASTEYPKGVNEFEKAGFTQLPSAYVKPPRVAESLVQMECIIRDIIALGNGPGAGNLVIAEVICLHMDESIFDDNGKIMQEKLNLMARMGGDLYARTGAENIFKVPKPLMHRGMGIDKLPVYIKNSTVLTGNDLAQLANVTQMPGVDLVEGYIENTPAITEQMNYLRPFPDSRLNYIHQRSKTMLRNGNLDEAWLNLLAGAHYEEIIVNDLINNQL